MGIDLNSYIYSYLEHPRSSPPSAELMVNPEATFWAIANYAGPYPKGLDPRDAGEPLCRLLAKIAPQVPDLMLSKMTEGDWGYRYLFISAAATSEDPRFISPILHHLNSRSIYIKDLILSLMMDRVALRREDAVPMLRHQLTLRSVQKDARVVRLVNTLLCLISEHPTTGCSGLASPSAEP